MIKFRGKNLWSQWDQLTMVDKLLYRIWVLRKQQADTLQLIIPHELQTAFIVQCHEGLIGGHLGLKKTLHQVQQRVYFHGWRNSTKRVC
jgi:Integrase zinc binding domain